MDKEKAEVVTKIQELEESKNVDEYGYEENETRDGIKKSIIQLGLENSLTSRYTSFVGILRK